MKIVVALSLLFLLLGCDLEQTSADRASCDIMRRLNDQGYLVGFSPQEQQELRVDLYLDIRRSQGFEPEVDDALYPCQWW